MGLLGRGWDGRGVHKRRRLRPSVAQRLGVVAGDVPTRVKLSPATLPARQEEAQYEEEENEEPTTSRGSQRRQGKDAKGKGKGAVMCLSLFLFNDSFVFPKPQEVLVYWNDSNDGVWCRGDDFDRDSRRIFDHFCGQNDHSGTASASTTASVSTTAAHTVNNHVKHDIFQHDIIQHDIVHLDYDLVVDNISHIHYYAHHNLIIILDNFIHVPTTNAVNVRHDHFQLNNFPAADIYICPTATSTFSPPGITSPTYGAAPSNDGGAGINSRPDLSSGATAGIVAGVLSVFLLLIGGICLCSRRARNRLPLFRRAHPLKVPGLKGSRERFQFGTTTTFISGPEDSMQQTRNLSTASVHSGIAHQSVRSTSSAASRATRNIEDERFSILSGLRQHPVSIIAKSEASFKPEPPANASSNTSMIAGRDSLRPFPATRGFGVPRDSLRASGTTWPINEAIESPRSDQFEYDPSDPSGQQRRLTDISSVAESLFNRTSQATSAFGASGLSPAPLPPPLPGPENNNNNPFVDNPQVPGMVYLPTRLTGFQTQQGAPQVIQPAAFARAGSGGWDQDRQPPANRPQAAESSGESLVEVTDLRTESPPLPSPGSRFSRPTTSESDRVPSEFSSDDDRSERRVLMRTEGFGVSGISDYR